MFIGVPKGKLMIRTDVSKKVNEYIRDNKLQDERDKRIILPDEKLKSLFSEGYTDDCNLDFFSMQKYLKHHFIKD